MSRCGIEVELDPEMTGDKIINPIPALKEGPAAIAEKALTAEAAWRAAEPRAEEAITATGTEPVSNAGTSFGNNNRPKSTAG